MLAVAVMVASSARGEVDVCGIAHANVLAVATCVVLAVTFGAALLRYGLPGRVDVHARGFVVRRWGAAPCTIALEDVDLCFAGSARDPLPRSIAITNHDGERIVFPATSKRARLAHLVRRRCTQPRVTEARAAFVRGEPLRFGRLAIDRKGLHFGLRTTPWPDVESVVCADGVLRVVTRDAITVATLPLHELPHRDALDAVLAEAAPLVRAAPVRR
jgi:hypothetical protein